ncbi:XRE family transcriptional regulator [Falsibacillus albus]|uniref:XRE family transcriptional regulator n=1 Tax=Falsibacillus albus TaxID=2478915 RepID=A0A3L7JZR6_9BACI|nr:XRE family transcriptional regulator [Falsibacillus albus]RLQ96277.1 XRE family transcriptional regulator [Falsibacillus albus]
MLGKKLYEIRKRRGYTLSEVADRAHISKSYLSNIERNLNQNPSITVIKKLAKVLNVDLSELIYMDSNERNGQDELEKEWIELANELKESGIEKGEIKEYKTLLEFIKWQNQKK